MNPMNDLWNPGELGWGNMLVWAYILFPFVCYGAAILLSRAVRRTLWNSSKTSVKKPTTPPIN